MTAAGIGRKIMDRAKNDGYFGASLFRNVGGRCSATALAVTLFSPVAAFIYAQQSGQVATKYDLLISEIKSHKENELATEDDKKIYRCCHIIVNQMKAERVGSSLSQLMMGTGLTMVLLALIIAVATDGQIPQIASIFRYGFTVTGLGMTAYTITQLFFHIEQKSRIALCYNELTLLLSPIVGTHKLKRVRAAPLVIPSAQPALIVISSTANTPKEQSPPPSKAPAAVDLSHSNQGPSSAPPPALILESHPPVSPVVEELTVRFDEENGRFIATRESSGETITYHEVKEEEEEEEYQLIDSPKSDSEKNK